MKNLNLFQTFIKKNLKNLPPELKEDFKYYCKDIDTL